MDPLPQEAINHTKKEMEEQLKCELSKAYEKSEQKLKGEIQKTLERCTQEKFAAVNKAIKQERELADEKLLEMKKTLMQQNREALAIADYRHQKNMEELQENMNLLMIHKVTVARQEEQDKMKDILKLKEVQHQAAIKEIKAYISKLEASHRRTEKQLKAVVYSKEKLEEEIVETRQAFQKYINFTFPQLGPGQADFILPYRTTI
ncbi:uncharacterized protein C6orf163 homolog [Pelobates fuscus]|uniref:uncharacterized protein C6orf163 homolog n=1 Tax=Pelobates fuscus TaxID=191477 RepID=UPI002FE4B1F7